MEKQIRQPECEGAVVRERLLSSALELFTTKGYSATSVREIVEAAGVTKPVLYYYFGNKEGIYLALMREPFARFESIMDESRLGTGKSRERLIGLCDLLFLLFVENLAAARLMYSIYYGPPQGAPFFDFEAYHLKFHDLIREQVAEGVRTGELGAENVDDLAWVIIGTLNVALEEQLCQTAPRIDREGLARLITLILKGFSGTRGIREE